MTPNRMRQEQMLQTFILYLFIVLVPLLRNSAVLQC